MTLVQVIGSSTRYREYTYSLQPYDTLCYLGVSHTLIVCYTNLDPKCVVTNSMLLHVASTHDGVSLGITSLGVRYYV